MDSYDVVVIGAGIHGAGVAQAAAARGGSVLVLEREAVAAGTSSRSSKLIHGGLRYLETGQWRLVREALAERETLLRVAPRLVRRLPFHVPVYAGSARGSGWLALGLSLYALLAGLKPQARFALADADVLAHADGLARAGLRRVFRYLDAQTDDRLLTDAVMRSARALGARLACPARFEGARAEGDRYVVHYYESGVTKEVVASTLVNAAGPWVNTVLDAIAPAPPRLAVDLVQGTHVLLPGTLSCGAYYLEAADRRAVFALPWQGRVLVGTTEREFTGDPSACVPTKPEIDYLLDTYRRYFPARDATVLEAFAGLRVLPREDRAPFARSRETRLVGDRPVSPRLVTIYGGKLTTYRATAERVVERLSWTLPTASPGPRTATLPL